MGRRVEWSPAGVQNGLMPGLSRVSFHDRYLFMPVN
jgi:hypothetical protein